MEWCVMFLVLLALLVLTRALVVKISIEKRKRKRGDLPFGWFHDTTTTRKDE